MSWSYSGNPANSALDALRFDIGDTDTTSQLLADEELNYVIAEESKQARRIARCFESIGRKLLQRPNFALDRWREDRHAVAKSYLEQAKELRKIGASQGVYAGGISVADKDTQNEDTDYDKPFASLDMDSYEPDDELTSD